MKKNWKKFLLLPICAMVLTGVVGVVSANAAGIDTSGCDDENNLYINPTLAMCSTHVYNIGLSENPENDSVRTMMDNVVKLKTTLVTQQMYQQYKFLDQALKQLRTQLRKEILMAQLKAAGGEGNEDNGGRSGDYSVLDDDGIKVRGANNCRMAGGDIEILECVRNNLNVVLTAIDADNLSSARKQLALECEALSIVGVKNVDDCKGKRQETEKVLKNKKKNDLKSFVYTMNAKVVTKLSQLKDQKNQRYIFTPTKSE